MFDVCSWIEIKVFGSVIKATRLPGQNVLLFFRCSQTWHCCSSFLFIRERPPKIYVIYVTDKPIKSVCSTSLCVSHFLSTILLYKHEPCNYESGISNHSESIRHIQFSLDDVWLHTGVLTDGSSEPAALLMTKTINNISTRILKGSHSLKWDQLSSWKVWLHWNFNFLLPTAM